MGLALTGCGGNDEGPKSVSGTFEFKMEDAGWSDQEEAPSAIMDPGLTISTSIGSGNLQPKYFNTGASIRLYPYNTITFSAIKLEEIRFTYTNVGQGFTPSTGEVSSDFYTWTGSTESVTFTVGSLTGQANQVRISAVKVTGIFKGGSTPTPSGDERTVESVANDIINLLFEDPDPASDISWDSGEAYIYVLTNDDNLEDACITATYYLPDYLEEDEAPTADTWDDGDDGYFATYVDVEYGIYVEIGTYENAQGFVAQYCVYTD